MKLSGIIIVLLTVLNFSCANSGNKHVVVDFAETATVGIDNNKEGPEAVYIAIASMTSPKETYVYYSDLIKYISDKVGHPIYIKQKKTYKEVNKLLENSDVDFAFICSGAFADEYEKGNIDLLVVPIIDDKVNYRAYIISHKESNIDKFEDFENKSFAYSDPLSNTGRLYPLKKLLLMHKSEKEFFQKTIYTYGHDISIQMVNRGIIEGASVNGLIYDYLSLNHPDKIDNVKIIEISEPFGIPPVVAPVSLPKKRFEEYQQIFLNLHNDSLGKKIMDKLNIDKFVMVDKEIYNSVFQLKETIKNVATK